MNKKFFLAGLLFIAAALVVTPGPAKAAMWVGVEVGPNWMGSSTLQLTESGGGAPLNLNNYNWETKVLGGVTFGYHFVNSGFLAYNWPDWMKYFQFAIDFSFHTIETGPKSFEFPQQEFGLSLSRIKGDVFTVAFLFIGCYGFYPDSVAPFGRVVPYIGVGPALVVSWLQGGWKAFNEFTEGGGFNRSSTDIALCAEAGVRFMALKNVSLDVAFRYRWLQPNYTFPHAGAPGININLGVNDANLFNVLFRASYHF